MGLPKIFLAIDDFDQDGYADLAVGIPKEDKDIGTVKDAGANGIYRNRTDFFEEPNRCTIGEKRKNKVQFLTI